MRPLIILAALTTVLAFPAHARAGWQEQYQRQQRQQRLQKQAADQRKKVVAISAHTKTENEHAMRAFQHGAESEIVRERSQRIRPLASLAPRTPYANRVNRYQPPRTSVAHVSTGLYERTNQAPVPLIEALGSSRSFRVSAVRQLVLRGAISRGPHFDFRGSGSLDPDTRRRIFAFN